MVQLRARESRAVWCAGSWRSTKIQWVGFFSVGKEEEEDAAKTSVFASVVCQKMMEMK